MRTDWASFAGTGNPSSRALPWPSFNGTRVLSLVPLQSQVTTDFAGSHVYGAPARNHRSSGRAAAQQRGGRLAGQRAGTVR
jgi:hypothetical protein